MGLCACVSVLLRRRRRIVTVTCTITSSPKTRWLLSIRKFVIFLKLKKTKQIYIQGVRLERSESYCLLLQKYGFYCPPEPTRGSPDMVHLVINAYTFSRQQYKGTMALQTITFVILEPKMPFLWNLENLKNSLFKIFNCMWGPKLCLRWWGWLINPDLNPLNKQKFDN